MTKSEFLRKADGVKTERQRDLANGRAIDRPLLMPSAFLGDTRKRAVSQLKCNTGIVKYDIETGSVMGSAPAPPA